MCVCVCSGSPFLDGEVAKVPPVMKASNQSKLLSLSELLRGIPPWPCVTKKRALFKVLISVEKLRGFDCYILLLTGHPVERLE